MARHSIEFLRYLMGLRGPRTALTAAETEQLRALGAGATIAIEVGVYEGATSAVLAAALAPTGTLYLVDPFFLDVRLERWLGFSFTGYVARRSVRRWPERTRFERATSLQAARSLALPGPADLIFIDAVHSYEAVRDDLHAWAPKLKPEGVLAFHDSRCCSARPDLTPETGPVRLLDEVRRGLHGAWRVVAEADSLTAITLAGGRQSASAAQPT
jgi:predicted O-methyltransferase YrrM